MSKQSVNGRTTRRKYPRKEQERKRTKLVRAGCAEALPCKDSVSANVEGKCQKYSRIGALTLLPLEEEVTLPNIKAVCKAHFKTNLECNVLAGEQGPSFTDASQIQNWNSERRQASRFSD